MCPADKDVKRRYRHRCYMSPCPPTPSRGYTDGKYTSISVKNTINVLGYIGMREECHYGIVLQKIRSFVEKVKYNSLRIF